MGCGPSKQAAAAVAAAEASVIQHRRGLDGSVRLAKSDHPPSFRTAQEQKQQQQQQQQANGTKTNTSEKTTGDQTASVSKEAEIRSEWKVRPGYSSGASSFSGSDIDEPEVLGEDGDIFKQASRHTDILALSTLRSQMVAEGDLTQTVVRIETAFGKPIEQVYDGVHDGPILGSGVSGTVRLVTHIATQVKYAVKCLDVGLIGSTEGLTQLRDEIFIMCQLDHPNIVRIEEVYESANEIYIVQELCLGGDLFDRLDEQTDYHYTEAQCARLVKQMLSSVRYLHSKGIIHRDLKLENFLFSTTKKDSELKMIDFGLSKHFEVGQCHQEKVGTPYTVAPEIIRGSYNEKSDVWALGVITFLLLSGETPFGGLDGESLLMVKENIMRAQLMFKPPDVWEKVSDTGKAFVKMLLNPDPDKRPTAKESQRDPWIQVWAKKDGQQGEALNSKTLESLMAFKEQSDMRKLLSEVLSFTLLPEQIVDLRKEFEKIDTDGNGEISLGAMKHVLRMNAEAGSLGALTEQEIEDIFDAIRVRKHEPTIRWHEFLAAGLSQARVDDRNLRLAFDRVDTDRKDYITFDNLQDLIGGSTNNSDMLEKIWFESLQECKADLDRITYDDFKKLMKGQPKETPTLKPSTNLIRGQQPSSLKPTSGLKRTELPVPSLPGDPSPPTSIQSLATVKEGMRHQSERLVNVSGLLNNPEREEVAKMDSVPRYRKTGRSHSVGAAALRAGVEEHQASRDSLARDAKRAVLLPGVGEEDEADFGEKRSALAVNRALYRKHREMRLAVMEASKQFDSKRTERQEFPMQAGLIMKRGVRSPVDVEDANTRRLYDAAAKRCGRARRNKTVSDVTGMLLSASA